MMSDQYAVFDLSIGAHKLCFHCSNQRLLLGVKSLIEHNVFGHCYLVCYDYGNTDGSRSIIDHGFGNANDTANYQCGRSHVEPSMGSRWLRHRRRRDKCRRL